MVCKACRLGDHAHCSAEESDQRLDEQASTQFCTCDCPESAGVTDNEAEEVTRSAQPANLLPLDIALPDVKMRFNGDTKPVYAVYLWSGTVQISDELLADIAGPRTQDTWFCAGQPLPPFTNTMVYAFETSGQVRSQFRKGWLEQYRQVVFEYDERDDWVEGLQKVVARRRKR